jgi:hypothetical protein
MRNAGIVVGLALALVCSGPALAEEGESHWRLSTSYNYLKGDYGTGQDTELVYVPVTFGAYFDPYRLTLTVPYLRQTSQNLVLTGGGVAVNKKKPPQSMIGAVAGKRTEDGLGDVLLRASYVLFEERPQQPWLPEVEPYLKIKFPTADKDRGLGTGEFDETIGVDLSKEVWDRTSAYVTLAYTFFGSPRGETLRDSFAGSIGAAYTVFRPLSVYAFLDGATAIAPGQDDPLEVRVGAEYRLAKFVKLTGSAMKGLSDGSADWGFSAGVALRF